MFGNPLNLGRIVGQTNELKLSPEARARHLYICGGTGTGKSKLLESCIRQDILNWVDSECGVLLLDPHGRLYKNIMGWLAYHGLDRTVIPIELGRNDWIVSYNLLRRRQNADPSVVVTNFIRALSHVWGLSGTDQTPLFARLAGLILFTLYENGCTLADITYLLSRDDVRRAMISKINDPTLLHEWQKAGKYPKDFDEKLTSTLNRVQRLTGPQVMRATLGQQGPSLDLLEALNKGQIILVNLSTEGGLIDQEDADTFATLVLADLWSAANIRGKEESENVKPFYVYIDECQKFITPTIAQNLEEARGFGLHLTLANQYPSQFKNAGSSGQAMYDAILGVVDNLIVFRTRHPEDSKVLAQSLFTSTVDTDEVKLTLLSTKVMGYRTEIQESHTTGSSESNTTSTGSGRGSFAGESIGEGTSSVENDSTIAAWNESVTNSSGESSSWSHSESTGSTESHSVTRTPQLVPIMGQELSSLQYRSIEEQMFRKMQTLYDQKDRHFVVRFYNGPRAPVFVKTPTISILPIATELVNNYREDLLRDLPFALRMPQAIELLQAQQKKLLTQTIHTSFPDDIDSAKSDEEAWPR